LRRSLFSKRPGRRGILSRLSLILTLILGGPVMAEEDLPVIRAAVLKIGTVNWELQTILREGFDRDHGFRLEVQGYADTAATHLAVQGGAADLAVADMIWLARQRAAGRDYVFIPYSRAVGGLVVPEGSPAESLADLSGGKIGIAGGPLDKSWLILRAHARATHDMDLAGETEQVFGAPPLIYKSALGADYAGAVNYWHYLARMKAEGMRELISVGDAAQSLGLDPKTPLLGYYMRESFLGDNAELAQAFYEASRAAKDLLGRSDAAWEALRPVIDAQSEAQFEQLTADWLEGVPPRGPVDPEGARAMFALMHDLGGRALMGDAAQIPPGLFADIE